MAVEDKISRNDEDLISHQIAQNETEGWVDPQIIKISNYLKNNSIKGLNANFTNEHNDLLIDPMQINFVQTDTNKLLFVIMALILLVSSFILFRIDKYKPRKQLLVILSAILAIAGLIFYFLHLKLKLKLKLHSIYSITHGIKL